MFLIASPRPPPEPDRAQRTAGGLLPKLTRSEPEHETFNHDAAQILVTTATACGRRAAVHQRIDPRHLVRLTRTVGHDDRPLDRPQIATASGPEGQTVRVRNVDREVDVAPVEGTAELRRGGILDPTVRIKLFGESGRR
jgi:hypothetical protein